METLKDQGITEVQIESFVRDLETELDGENLTENNFKSKAIGAVLNIAREHGEFIEAMAAGFELDVEEILNGQVPGAFLPVYNTIKDNLVQEESPPGGSVSNDGGAPPPAEDEEPVEEPAETIQEPAEETTQTDEQQKPNQVQVRFVDVEKHWAQMEIGVMIEAGVVRDVSDQEFKPNDPVTRAQFATMLLRLLNVQENSNAAAMFKDVGAQAWYRGVVGAALQEGFLGGYDAERFGPDDPVTREQMKDISSWALVSIGEMVARGLMTGRDTGKFVPQGQSTRAEAVVLLYRLRNQIM